MDVNSIWWFVLSLNLFWIIGILLFVIYLEKKKNKEVEIEIKKLEKIHSKDKLIKG